MLFGRRRSLHSHTSKKVRKKKTKARRTPEEVAAEWAELIDGVTIRTRADLARHLGVSRARVTQVLGVRGDRSP